VAPSRWRARAREAVRRLAAGLALLVAAGAGLGDDLRSAPDARLGSRSVRLDLPHLGTTDVQIPQAAPTGVVLLLHHGGSHAERTTLTHAVPWHVLLVDVDTRRLGVGDPACGSLAARLEDISRRAQRDAGLTRYFRPVVVATTGALPVAAPAMAGALDAALPAAVSVGTPVGDLDMACGEVPSAPGLAPTTRWRFASSSVTLRAPLDEALAAAAAPPALDATPVQRWLQHFDLPLTAAWSSKPRGMLVLLSPERGWRQPEEALAQQLAAAGIHVVGIDALRSFWQRRSPRDVALELKRLTDALASTGLPVFIGGRQFGAETMAVVGEMMAPGQPVAGMVLVDPGPTAFFEVEPPALALRPVSPSDWSTRAAVTRIDRPTLCVTHTAGSPSALLCGALSGRGQATLAQTADNAAALSRTIARFILAP
jgi:type IV secretory pathway VirJ component